MASKPDVEYGEREALDGELAHAVDEILAAEVQATQIIEKAEASAKAIQLDGAARERAMRDEYARADAKYRADALAATGKRADAECEKLVAAAQKDGEKLVAAKKADIEKRAKELFSALGGK